MLPVLKIVTDLIVGLLLQFTCPCFACEGEILNILPLSFNQHTEDQLPLELRHKCIVRAVCQCQSKWLLVPSALSL